MKASKGNKEYTITESQKDSFVAQGYDITIDGKVVAYGKGKTVDLNKYKELETKYKELEESYKALEAKYKELETVNQEETKEKKTTKK